MAPDPCPFKCLVFRTPYGTTDIWPASYHVYEPLVKNGKQSTATRRVVANPAKSDEEKRKFLVSDLSIDSLSSMEKHLWWAGSRRPPIQLHLQVAIGRQIVVDERMDHHLVWDNSGRIFIRPMPPFLLDCDVWDNFLACSDINCTCGTDCPPGCMQDSRKIARGFLYTYSCLVSSRTDFFLANEHHLLPQGPREEKMTWDNWKVMAREILESCDRDQLHPRFQRGELRLSRLNIIHRITRRPPFRPYIRGWRNYSSILYGNLTWMATAAVFIALILTAMQVGLATDRLGKDSTFQQASYGFTVFAIIGPIGVFALVVLAVLYNFVKDLPWLLSSQVRGRSKPATSSPDRQSSNNQGQGGQGSVV
ncbi:hypothetical protein F5Y14DRAFT_405044 [Nemania sp. NC0429]|nr:hypothetical protein F5Y14DRAFT_405044 [Nemania sp. NC0429]